MQPIRDLHRLYHTVRHLRAGQVTGRVRFRLSRPAPDLAAAPTRRKIAGRWHGCQRQSSLNETGFRFLGQRHPIAHPADWDDPARPRLWRYNLHYFDHLAAKDAHLHTARDRELMIRWITDNPPPEGSGWEPYPCSLRIVNWIRWALTGQPLDSAAHHSLAVQSRWLARRLETHLLGNHLWANAKALVFAGSFFAGTEADTWRTLGLRLIDRELDEQILADGGHFERSPMYHAIVLEDLLDLVQLARMFPACIPGAVAHGWCCRATRMLHWMQIMTHPDGHIALFNDAAFGIAPPAAHLFDYAARLDVKLPHRTDQPIQALADSGYVRLQAGPAVLIADVGEIGPDYLPGHAHADSLSCELSLHGRRLLVNGGTSTYEANAERLRQRGTASHNTVSINDQDSSEVWSSFRVARRARPCHVDWGQDPQGPWLAAAHDGYQRLPGRPVHHRRWQLAADGLLVDDRIAGCCHHATSHWHIHPIWDLRADSATTGTMRQRINPRDYGVHWQTDTACRPRIDAWNPVFGAARPGHHLTCRFQSPTASFALQWA